MKYNVIAKSTCYGCNGAPVSKILNVSDIEAESDSQARERFKEKYRLCPDCLAKGTPIALEFDSFINVEPISGFGIKRN